MLWDLFTVLHLYTGFRLTIRFANCHFVLYLHVIVEYDVLWSMLRNNKKKTTRTLVKLKVIELTRIGENGFHFFVSNGNILLGKSRYRTKQRNSSTVFSLWNGRSGVICRQRKNQNKRRKESLPFKIVHVDPSACPYGVVLVLGKIIRKPIKHGKSL